MIQIVKDSDTRPWFFLQTAHTTYGMWVMETGHLEHLYYGERITVDSQDPSSCAPLVIQRAFAPGNTCTYDREHPQISMEDVCLEVGTLGKGDIREPFLEVRFADGSVTSDFTFDSYEIITLKEREQCLQDSGLPHSYSEVGTDSAECLQIVLQDVTNHLELQLFYTVFEECDVITRSARLINHSDASVTLNRCLSAQLDLTEDYSMITHFSGAWAREMHREQISLRSGKFVNVGDEPAELSGTDSGMGPAEYILQALAGCYTATLTVMAAEKGIELDGIDLDLNFDIDLNGFLGLDDKIRKGAKGIRVGVKLSSPTASREQLEEMVRALPASSPIHDTLANPVSIDTRLV